MLWNAYIYTTNRIFLFDVAVVDVHESWIHSDSIAGVNWVDRTMFQMITHSLLTRRRWGSVKNIVLGLLIGRLKVVGHF